ncbi:embryonic protein UVS.2-like isoform X2 [Hyla sarda]|nr:embryonic protein UVS.2-like isoform X2 [Hyla sarda]
MFVRAMKEYEVMTCVDFISRTTEKDYLLIENKAGCWSYVGKVGGKQSMSLSKAGCIKYNLIQHELMHALGFNHEMTRKDRDNYIDVIWENIAPADQAIFTIDNGDLQDMPYDYYSITHYLMSAFSRIPGEPSMVPKYNLTIPMGRAIGLDDLDVMKVNSLYDCNLCRRKLFAPGSTTYDSTSLGQGKKRCLYLIQSTLKVRLQLSDINFPSSPDCNSAYIKVYDGVSPSSPVLLDRKCDRKPVPPLISSEDFILIEIVNNQLLASSTFTASYERERYGNTFVQDNGVVTSPGFPGLYPSNVDVVYSIIAPTGYKVSLSFGFFWIENSTSCSKEYLTVMDGVLETSSILATYCGFMDITPLVSTGNSLVLQFHSGDSAGFNGFYATYKFVTTS